MAMPDTGSLHSLTLVKNGNQGLGFCIRGGSEHGLGIYVSEVEPQSAAGIGFSLSVYAALYCSTTHITFVSDLCGLCKGDCILEVNNVTFENIASSSAINVFAGHSRLKMLVRRVGKIPGHKYAQEKTIWLVCCKTI